MRFDEGSEFFPQTQISSLFSAWRADRCLLGTTQPEVELYSITELEVEDQLDLASALTVHNTHNYVALGNRDKHETLIQVYRLPTTRSEFSLERSVRLSEGCTHLSWVDEHLLASSFRGRVHLFDTPASPALRGAANNTLIHTYDHFGFKGAPEKKLNPGPGKLLLSSAVNRAEINPVSRSSFLSLMNNYFFWWDLERNDVPITTQKGSTSPLYAVEWNPHSGRGDGDFLLGGAKGDLKLLDARLLSSRSNKCVVWKAAQAHTGSIYDISWSPLVSHWVATAGEDGNVAVWDLRFGTSPVREIQHHVGVAQHVEWSRSHCEILVSGGSDTSLVLSNLRSTPHSLMVEKEVNSGIAGVGVSPVNPWMFFGLGTQGELMSLELNTEYMENFVLHRYEYIASSHNDSHSPAPPSGASSARSLPSTSTTQVGPGAGKVSAYHVGSEEEASELRDVERLLYLRDFSQAFKRIARLAETYFTEKEHEKAELLLKMCSPANFNQAAARPTKSFTRLINDLSYFTPPHTLQLTQVDKADNDKIQMLKLRLALLRLVEDGKYEDILALEQQIVTHLRVDGEAFSSDNLQRLVLTILPQDYLEGLSFALHIGEALFPKDEQKDTEHFENFGDVAKALFYPT